MGVFFETIERRAIEQSIPSDFSHCAITMKASTQEEYDQWRYQYPAYDRKPGWVKTIPSQGLNDLVVNALKENMD